MKRLFLVLSALLLAPLTHAALDLNNDGIPDVWALVHGLGAIDMNQDSDGDGQTNAQEALWGTNPLSAAGTARITSITTDEYGVHLIFAGQAGKQYQVQATTSLGGGWSNVGAVIHGSEGDITASPEVTNADQKFYRVTVSDTDSDGDGVSDWEEIKLGFDPNNSHSGGSNGPDDLAAITSALTAPSVISVSSIDNAATEPAPGVPAADTAAFVISRTGGLKPTHRAIQHDRQCGDCRL
jgi:hypothetical protein